MKILSFTLMLCITLNTFAQHKTAAHYWGKIPSYPSADAQSFRKFIEDCEELKREIHEEAEKQNALLEQKVSTVNPASMQMPQNMNPAAIQKMMQRTQERTDLMNEMTAKSEQLKREHESVNAKYERLYNAKVKTLEKKADKLCPDGAMSVSDEARVPACNAALKELDAARASFLNEQFLNGQSPFKSYLGNYAAWLKKTEPQIIKMRDESFEGTGISAKGLPCADSIKPLMEYLTQMQHFYERALTDNLVK